MREYVANTGRETEANRSKPQKWIRDGAYIYLWPTPDAVYTMYVYYRKRPSPLSSGTETTVIGAEWDQPILWLATVDSLVRFNDFENLDKWKNEFLGMIRDRIGIYDKEQRDSADYFKVDFVHKEMSKYGR